MEVAAADDLWTCGKCGWTYPNAHPSAKHRRNHKKVCGKVPGHNAKPVHPADGGSSDEASSGDEHSVASNAGKGGLLKYAETLVSTTSAGDSKIVPNENGTVNHFDEVSRSLDIGSADGPQFVEAKGNGDVKHSHDVARSLDMSSSGASKVVEANGNETLNHTLDVTGSIGIGSVSTPNAGANGNGSVGLSYEVVKQTEPTNPLPLDNPEVEADRKVGSHPEDDVWICRECGWSYPNAHPSAKHRRNHKKHCPGTWTAAAAVSDEKLHSYEGQAVIATQELVTDPSSEVPSIASREFKLESVPSPAPEVNTAVEATAETHATPAEAPEAGPTPAPPVVAPKVGSAVPHPEDDIWICRQCQWTYPNAHPSAKHRRNHKKLCPGKVAVVVPAPGGSSDDESDDEHHRSVASPQVSEADKVNTTSAAPTNLSREIDLGLQGAQQFPAVPASTVETAQTQAPIESRAGKTPVEEGNSVGTAPALVAKVGSAVPHPEDDLWICRQCGWTYPNAHPSAKHRRNHKKSCKGKVAVAAPVPGGSSDDDSDGEHHAPPPQITEPESTVVAGATTPAPNTLSREFKIDAVAIPVGPGAKEEEQTVPFAPSAELKDDPTDTAAPPAAEVIGSKKDELAVSITPPAIAQFETTTPARVPKVGSAVPHPEEDVWICRECGWTYPNAHPSAKHRRNHKKQCAGKVAPVASATGGSSDDDSDGEHQQRSGEKPVLKEAGNLTSAPASLADAGSAPVDVGVKDRELPSSSAPSPSAPASEVPKTLAAAIASEKQADKAEVSKVGPTTIPSREQEAKAREEPSKNSHNSEHEWTCKDCGCTYPNAHPSSKQRRNHKKTCKKTHIPSSAGGSSSDASSDDERLGHYGKKKCFPCL